MCDCKWKLINGICWVGKTMKRRPNTTVSIPIEGFIANWILNPSNASHYNVHQFDCIMIYLFFHVHETWNPNICWMPANANEKWFNSEKLFEMSICEWEKQHKNLAFSQQFSPISSYDNVVHVERTSEQAGAITAKKRRPHLRRRSLSLVRFPTACNL